MGHVLGEMFRWPDGIVVGNLIASALWAAPALVHLHRKLDRQHAERGAEAARLLAEVGEARKDFTRTIQVINGATGGKP